ncbi:hypothetical protein [Chryseobacterium sp. NFX27]|uniref:hypothetical protein n=1 Tax=Chryseobacterium sp. NFX27 TaxID=2819618 RepID=UPI003CF7DBA3
MKNTFKNINEYILLFPDEVQQKLIKLRETIHSEIIGLEEYIGYQMPDTRENLWAILQAIKNM